jgi:hypothetical protein
MEVEHTIHFSRGACCKYVLSPKIGISTLFFQSKLRLVTVFGAGLLVGTALAVIIPEGVQALYEASSANGMFKKSFLRENLLKQHFLKVLGHSHYTKHTDDSAPIQLVPAANWKDQPNPHDHISGVDEKPDSGLQADAVKKPDAKMQTNQSKDGTRQKRDIHGGIYFKLFVKFYNLQITPANRVDLRSTR